ncbi:MAG TPA: S8 family serine peptidase [Thermoanaerobaculia bacterium]|nr:S8 family serine peptidase [Thermoanaerobaculia bacterium]
MIKRLALLFLAIPALAFGDASIRHPYLVATKAPLRQLRSLIDASDRVTAEFDIVDGFAADLTDDEVARLRRSSSVRYVTPDAECHILEVDSDISLPLPAAAGQSIPYGIKQVHADLVWPYATGAKIRVGIIDTGIDYLHPDLVGRFRGGYDFYNHDDDPMDDNGHGTHVAGTVAANNNEIGVVGVAPGVDLYALKVLNSAGSGSAGQLIAALDWAVANKLNVLNMSLGFGTSSPPLLEEAFRRVREAGILPIAAAGNDGTDGISYPAAYPGVIAVGAVGEDSHLASFSNRGPQLLVVAPGIDVYSSLPSTIPTAGAIRRSDGVGVPASPLTYSPVSDFEGPFVSSGLGYPADFTGSVIGKIALIRRGELTFGEKAQNAMRAGAKAVVIYNNVPGPFNGTLGGVDRWPLTVGISMDDGLALINNSSLRMTVSTSAEGYGKLSGTSMSTPHVTGVAALVWSLKPTVPADSVRAALSGGAHDLGDTGFDLSFGFGLIDAYAAGNLLVPGRFSQPPAPQPVPRSHGVRH